MKLLKGIGPNISLQVALLVTECQLNLETLSSFLWGPAIWPAFGFKNAQAERVRSLLSQGT